VKESNRAYKETNYIFNLERTIGFIEITRCQNTRVLQKEIDYEIFKEKLTSLDILPD
jgi:hypothetical protein